MPSLPAPLDDPVILIALVGAIVIGLLLAMASRAVRYGLLLLLAVGIACWVLFYMPPLTMA